MATIKHLKIKDTYTSNGTENTRWNDVGILVTKEDGKQFIKLNMFPGLIINAFEPKDKDAAPQKSSEAIPF